MCRVWTHLMLKRNDATKIRPISPAHSKPCPQKTGVDFLENVWGRFDNQQARIVQWDYGAGDFGRKFETKKRTPESPASSEALSVKAGIPRGTCAKTNRGKLRPPNFDACQMSGTSGLDWSWHILRLPTTSVGRLCFPTTEIDKYLQLCFLGW